MRTLPRKKIVTHVASAITSCFNKFEGETMISPVIKKWRDKKKKSGYCQFCWKRKRQQGSTKTLCATCRRYKINYAAKKREEAGIKPRGKPTPKPYGVLPYKPRPDPGKSLEFANAAYEREQLAKLDREEERRKAVRSAWLQEHGIELRA